MINLPYFQTTTTFHHKDHGFSCEQIVTGAVVMGDDVCRHIRHSIRFLILSLSHHSKVYLFTSNSPIYSLFERIGQVLSIETGIFLLVTAGWTSNYAIYFTRKHSSIINDVYMKSQISIFEYYLKELVNIIFGLKHIPYFRSL